MHISSLLRSSVVVAGVVAPWLVAAAEGSDVVDLTLDTFGPFVESESLALVEFFAPWCGHCKALAPHYEEAATALKPKNISLAKIDCVDQAELCSAHGVTGYPTIKVYRNGSPVDYNGPRVADGIISYMTKQALPAVTTVTEENHEEVKVADKVVVIAYVASTTEAPAPVFSAVADKLREEFLFGISSDAAAIAAAGVTPPAVVLYKKFDEGKNELSAEEIESITAETLEAFVKTNSVPLFDELTGETYGGYASTGIPLAYLFVDPADPKKEEYIKALTPLAKTHKGAINFVWIDAVRFADHGKTLALEPKWPGFVIQDIKAQLKYPLDQSVDVSFEAVSQLTGDFVKGTLAPKMKTQEKVAEQTDSYYNLVGSEFEDVLYDDDKDVFVQFSASWCGHCKKLAPTWETLAEKYAFAKDSLLIAKMDAGENDIPVSAGFSVAGFPTIKFKAAGTRNFIDYEGDRSLESLIEFLESKVKSPLVAPVVEEKLEQVVLEEASAAVPVATPEAVHQEL